MTRTKRFSLLLLVPAISCLYPQAGLATEEFHAYVTPDTAIVARFDVAEVAFEVDSTAHQFNGYDVTIQFDPKIISFHAVQAGELITESCDRWYTQVTSTDSTVSISHIILCEGVSMDGPGVLSRIQFNADSLGYSPLTFISDPDSSFFDSGLYVWPGNILYPRQVFLHGGGILVLDGASPVEEGRALSGFGLENPAPNPLLRQTCISYDLPHAEPVRLWVIDVQGRVVRRLIDGERSAGRHRLVWDGTNEAGRRVAGGGYYITFDVPGGRECAAITVLR